MKERETPPKLAEWILGKFPKFNESFNILEDFRETFFRIVSEKGRQYANFWYWYQVIFMIIETLCYYIFWSAGMFKNYIKTAFRNMKKQKIHSFINLSGLILSLSILILIFLYITNEYSFDMYNKNADRIFRVAAINKDHGTGELEKFAAVPGLVSDAIKETLPEIENSIRLVSRNRLIKHNTDAFNVQTILYSDPDYFKIFTHPLLSGDPETVLNLPYSILISEEIAGKYYTNINAVGKTVTFNDKTEYTIKGVFRDIPENSHFNFDFIASIEPARRYRLNRPTSHDFWTYIKVRENTNKEEFVNKITAFSENWKKSSGGDDTFFLQKLEEIHFQNDLKFEIGIPGDIRYIYLLAAISILILLIASFNYINLTTARYSRRAKEVGLRKIIGAERKTLVMQFLGESVTFTLIASIISLVIVFFSLPHFNSFFERNLNFSSIFEIETFLVFAGMVIVTGLLSGAYPAFYLTSFLPVDIIRGTKTSGSAWIKTLRRILICCQFIFTVFLLVCTAVVHYQLDLMKNRSFGKQRIKY